ncbi:MAG: glucokinase, partial [Gammaproteobacteria bacterium]|nr:glucokinase [Gammaproteobacteria bacterium]
EAACFAVAAPVESGVARVTNLPWIISEKELVNYLHAPKVKLINDFVAASYGISELQDADMLVLQQGLVADEMSAHPDAAIIGAGTGFGVSHRVWLNDHYQVFSSEAGHAGFAPENAEQSELLTWMQKKQPHVSLEMVLSGKGLITIYDFLHDAIGVPESWHVKQAMQKTDPAQAITEYGLLGSDALCQKTLEVFIDIYGAASSNVALYYYPVTELYIAGGIAPKIKDKMLGQRFIDAFVNKGIMSSNMEKITIKLIMQEKAGLYGALSRARMLLV